MAQRKKAPPAERVRRRAKDAPRKGLDPDLEAFARSDEKRFRPRTKRSPRLKDPRPQFQIPGVANRDGRALFEARVEALGQLDPAGDDYARALAEICWLRLWRGRSVTSFESFVEDVLGSDAAAARSAAERGAGERGLEPLSDETVALWLRIEAAALETEAAVRIELEGEEMGLRFDLPKAPEFLNAVGRRLIPLVQDRAPKPPRDPEDDGRGGRDGERRGRDGERRGGREGERRGGREGERRGGRDGERRRGAKRSRGDEGRPPRDRESRFKKRSTKPKDRG